MNEERIARQFAFLREIDKEKNIFRQTYLLDGKRRENDAEHAWHMALFVMILAEHSNEPIDVLKTMSMVLIHDLVEIYAGDTFAYDEGGKESQRQRELEAADKLFAMLPEDQAEKIRGLWEEFEAWETPEAKFARSMDNFQPLMLNDATKGISWQEHGVALKQVLKRNERSHMGSEELWSYVEKNFIMPHAESGVLKTDEA